MGTWGTGIFDNDSACDWAQDLAESSDLSVIEAALDGVLEAGSEYLEVDEATEAFDEGARKQKIGFKGGVKIAALGGLVHTMAHAMTGSHLHGAFWNTLTVTKSVRKAKEGLYAKTHEGKVALARVEAAVEKLEAARKEVTRDYQKTVINEVRQLAGQVKAARMG